MKRIWNRNLFLLVLLFSFFSVLGIERITGTAELKRLKPETCVSMQFREQTLDKEMLQMLEHTENKGRTAGLYLLESRFSYDTFIYPYTEETFHKLFAKWASKEEWADYQKTCEAISNDLIYFPVPKSSLNPKLKVNYINSWQQERNYGGKEGMRAPT